MNDSLIRRARWLLMVTAAAFAPNLAAQEFDRTRLQICPHSPADIKQAIGLEVGAGKPAELPYPNGRILSCTYTVGAGQTSLFVNQTWIPPRILAATLESMDKYASGKLTAIPGDADRARWQTDPENRNNLALQYTRQNVRTEVRLQGGKFKPDEMQPRLLKLRRVP